jgi:hypothetical protein
MDMKLVIKDTDNTTHKLQQDNMIMLLNYSIKEHYKISYLLHVPRIQQQHKMN